VAQVVQAILYNWCCCGRSVYSTRLCVGYYCTGHVIQIRCDQGLICQVATSVLNEYQHLLTKTFATFKSLDTLKRNLKAMSTKYSLVNEHRLGWGQEMCIELNHLLTTFHPHINNGLGRSRSWTGQCFVLLPAHRYLQTSWVALCPG
jgi:hypothetical protein